MADPFVAEIRMFAGNFAPTGWATCDGQILPISQNTALFSLLGTTYGGNGQSTFALPNLQDSAPLHPGQGQGLSLYDLGQSGGEPFVTLIQSEIPVHNHNLMASQGDGNDTSPNAELPSSGIGVSSFAVPVAGTVVNMDPRAAAPAGGSLPHNNMMPYLTVTFIIAMQGVFPPRQ